ncbi:MAG: hypothetical protein MUP24_08355 [Gillisia sp.]|nr:hypothetical protein [Gillisia sp.]
MKLFILVMLVTSFTGCAKVDNSAKNIALIEKYVQSVESEDTESIASLLDDNYLGVGPSYGDSIRKPAAMENWKDNITNLYDKIAYNKSRNAAFTLTEGANQGEWVSNWAELKITYKGDKGEVIIWANTIYKIENEKIVKSITFYNEADALRQLGYVFINPNDL